MKTLAHKTKDTAKVGSRSTSGRPTHQAISPFLQLQRQLGNQSVQRLLKTTAVQAKLTIGHPNDVYEQEADRVADEIMRMPEPDIVSAGAEIAPNSPPRIQRLCPECEGRIARQAIDEEEEEEREEE